MSETLISFSGGKTSAMMTSILMDQFAKDCKIVFANTGLEHPKTLEFIERCRKHFGWPITYLETRAFYDERKRSGYRLRSPATLSRNGEPFLEMILKYGISNKSYPHCTRELKINPIHAWARDHLSDDYVTAIGIRADEIDRVPHDYKAKRYIYPLIDYGITKKHVEEFWSKMPFTLEIPDYLGNCVTCWKKSNKKLETIARETPEAFDFMNRMEKGYGDCGAGTGARKFFRGNRSAEDILKGIQSTDDADLGDCGNESCEVF